MTDVIPGVEVQNFQLADSFGANDFLLGYNGNPAIPGSERRYPYAIVAAGGGVGGSGGGGYYLPETYGAVGDAGAGGTVTDDTAAFYAMLYDISQKTPRGGRVWLNPEKCYAMNLTLDYDNIQIESQCGALDANVLVGITSYNANLPALAIGNTTRQLRKFRMKGVRIYRQNAKFGLLIQSCANAYIDDCEIGGFANAADGYALWITSNTGANTYYCRMTNCYIFATGYSQGRLVQLSHNGSGFTAAISFSGTIDASAMSAGALDVNGMATARMLAIFDAVEFRLGDNTWMQTLHQQGIEFFGTGRLRCGEAMLDSGTDTDLLVRWPTNENSPNSFIFGDLRIDGQGRNSAGQQFDLRNPFAFGTGVGLSYGQLAYRQTLIGPSMQVDTSSPTLSGPITQVGGGGPEGSISATLGGFFRSVNNQGSSDIGFLKVLANIASDDTKGWENICTGDWVHQTQPTNVVIGAAGTAHLADVANGKGDFCFVNPGATDALLQYLGTCKSGRPRMIQINGTMTLVHTASGAGIFVMEYRRNLSLLSGDMIFAFSQGNNVWRVFKVVASDARAL
jgi:hypothetical protein